MVFAKLKQQWNLVLLPMLLLISAWSQEGFHCVSAEWYYEAMGKSMEIDFVKYLSMA